MVVVMVETYFLLSKQQISRKVILQEEPLFFVNFLVLVHCIDFLSIIICAPICYISFGKHGPFYAYLHVLIASK